MYPELRSLLNSYIHDEDASNEEEAFRRIRKFLSRKIELKEKVRVQLICVVSDENSLANIVFIEANRNLSGIFEAKNWMERFYHAIFGEISDT